MREQINTIREALTLSTDGPIIGRDDMVQKALTALTQLEAMAGEPVAKLHDDGYWTPMKTEAGRALNDRLMRAGSPSIEVYTAAPVAQQYEAGDMAAAAAQGFRDGVASVAQQQEPVAWAMPKGDGTFIDVITPAEHAREEGSYTVPLFAHPVAQQPQAEAVPNIDRMADRLMSWPLPKNFHPDGRIGFDRIGLDALGYPRGWPTGTNLLTHEQAKAMFEYVLGTNPSAHASPPANCRQRLKAEGKPYPRSSCESCGQLSPMWKACDAALTSEGGSK